MSIFVSDENAQTYNIPACIFDHTNTVLKS